MIHQVLNLRQKTFCLTSDPNATVAVRDERSPAATHHFGVAAEGGQVQWRASAAVGLSGGGAPLHQLSDQLELSFEARPAQRRQAFAVSLLQRGTWQQKRGFTLREPSY